MLSILIPVFNCDIVELVKTIHHQCSKSEIKFEIIALDDASDEWYVKLNNVISKLEHTTLARSINNRGRAETRKLLAEKAKYPTLLFLDADAFLFQDDFIENYINHIPSEKVICGGHIYQENIPETQYLLHWTYGRKVEARSLRKRLEHPYQSFSTFNFCINRDLYIKLCKEINLKTYGHEDTLIGYLLKREKISIKHITNPATHTGLKSTHIFLEDSNNAVKNSLKLYGQYQNINISLIRVYLLLKKLRLTNIVRYILNLSIKSMKRNLYGATPSMTIFKLSKLHYLVGIESTSF